MKRLMLAFIAIAALLANHCISSSYPYFILEDEVQEAETPPFIPDLHEVEFIAHKESRVDFLWVIDNSGSMGSYQAELQSVAATFVAAIASVGFDYQLGVITTDSSELITSPQSADAFTSDLEEFEKRILVGTAGSGNERGIFFAEQALQDTTQGDATDGPVTLAGVPHDRGKLHVIVVSDEKNNYPGFDTAKNLFVDRDIVFHSIIDPTEPGDYLALTNATLGLSVSIFDTDSFDSVMQQIVDVAVSLNDSFYVAEAPLALHAVRVNGFEVAQNTGWVYDAATHELRFLDGYIPQVGDVIRVEFTG